MYFLHSLRCFDNYSFYIFAAITVYLVYYNWCFINTINNNKNNNNKNKNDNNNNNDDDDNNDKNINLMNVIIKNGHKKTNQY